MRKLVFGTCLALTLGLLLALLVRPSPSGAAPATTARSCAKKPALQHPARHPQLRQQARPLTDDERRSIQRAIDLIRTRDDAEATELQQMLDNGKFKSDPSQGDPGTTPLTGGRFTLRSDVISGADRSTAGLVNLIETLKHEAYHANHQGTVWKWANQTDYFYCIAGNYVESGAYYHVLDFKTRWANDLIGNYYAQLAAYNAAVGAFNNLVRQECLDKRAIGQAAAALATQTQALISTVDLAAALADNILTEIDSLWTNNYEKGDREISAETRASWATASTEWKKILNQLQANLKAFNDWAKWAQADPPGCPVPPGLAQPGSADAAGSGGTAGIPTGLAIATAHKDHFATLDLVTQLGTTKLFVVAVSDALRQKRHGLKRFWANYRLSMDFPLTDVRGDLFDVAVLVKKERVQNAQLAETKKAKVTVQAPGTAVLRVLLGTTREGRAAIARRLIDAGTIVVTKR